MSVIKYKNPETGEWEKVGAPSVDTYSKDAVDAMFADRDAELEEVKTSVSEGKALIAAAVTDKGVATAADATFAAMANNIAAIETSQIPYEIIKDVYVYTRIDDSGNSNKEFEWSGSNLGKYWFANGVTFQIDDIFISTSHKIIGEYSLAGSTTRLHMIPFSILPNGTPSSNTPKLLANEKVYGFVIRGTWSEAE